MKKRFLFLVCMLIVSLMSFADEQRKVTLCEDHLQDMIKFGNCNVFITQTSPDDEGNVGILLEVENLNEENSVILFGHAYPEKELKKQKPSVVYDKSFSGTKGLRTIDTYNYGEIDGYLRKDDIRIDPSDKRQLPDFKVKDGVIQQLRLPFYFVKYKNDKRKKIMILDKRVLDLEITVDMKPDENYIALCEQCDSLIETIGMMSFCTNSRHKPSLVRQQLPFKEKIDELKQQIDDIISAQRIFSSDNIHMRYNALKQRLDSINLSDREYDCGQHKVTAPGHSCKYCTLSLQQIYHKMDDCYKKIYSSSDRKKTKGALTGIVNALYRCCTDKRCKKHANAWRNGGAYRNKIEDRYDRINKF